MRFTSAYRTVLNFAGRLLRSTLALLSILLVYLLLGASLFEYIEKPNELQRCFDDLARYSAVENSTLQTLLKIDSQDYSKEELVEVLQSQLRTFRSLSAHTGYNGENCTLLLLGEVTYKWSWASSMLFCITIVTTIGYGHISLRTTWGKIICIFYSTFGISLMLLCLTKIGDTLTRAFKYSYWQLCCCGVCFRQNKVSSQELDHVELTKWEQMPDESSVSADMEDRHPHAPLSVAMFMVVLYIMTGAAIFSHYEGWDIVTSAYFCFITLTTIGFGDLVPGLSNASTPQGKIRMFMTGTYILFGLAFLAMCLTMIQDQLHVTINKVMNHLRLNKRNHDSDN